MNVVDLVLLIVLGGFMLYGLWFGIIHMVGSLAGFVVGAFVAGRLYGQVGEVILPLTGGNRNLADVIAFFALFILLTRLVGLVFNLLEKVFNVVAVLPFLKTFNRLLGAIFGLLEGALVLGLAVYFAARFPITPAFVTALADSTLAGGLNLVGLALSPLLPQAVQALDSVLKRV
ncbi:MAG: CvpA family protein [bacterium]